MNTVEQQRGEIIIYGGARSKAKLEVKLHDVTVWLNQNQMPTVFAKEDRTVSEHIINIFKEKELEQNELSGNSGRHRCCGIAKIKRFKLIQFWK